MQRIALIALVLLFVGCSQTRVRIHIHDRDPYVTVELTRDHTYPNSEITKCGP